MNVDTLITTIEKRIKQKKENINYQEVGILIKKRRQEMRLTQECISSGICSISYLSKVENNKINPNKENLAFIMERLDLNYEGITVNYDQDKIIGGIIEYYFSKKIEDYKELLNELKGYETTLIYYVAELGFDLLTEKDIDSKRIIKENITTASNMPNDVFELFYLFTATYLAKCKEYNEALSLLETLSELSNADRKLLVLILECKFYCLADKLKAVKATMYYNELKNYYVEVNNLKRLADIQQKMIVLSFETGDYLSAIEMGQRCDKEFFKDMPKINFYIAASYFNINDYINSLKYLEKVESTSSYYSVALIYKCMTLKEMNEDYTSVFEELTNLKVANNVFKAFVELFIKNEKKEVTRNFLIENILSVVEKEGTPYEIMVIRSEISRYLASNSRYKEAMCYTK